jgi:hypothetical protein
MQHHPFPGMNPYLEGNLWSDVHHELASVIRQFIAPQISPKYVTRIESYIVKDTAAEEEIGIMYPDVSLWLQEKKRIPMPSPTETLTATPPTTTIETTQTFFEVQIPVIEIRDRFTETLITAIEILSPVNKRGEALQKYRKKRNHLISSDIHFLEIDLLRRGKRPLAHPLVPLSDYLITLTKAGEERTYIWAVQLKDNLPIVPVPLKTPDADVLLDLGLVLNSCFERGWYHLSINYEVAPPPPKLEESTQIWMKSLLDEWKTKQNQS